MIILQEFCDPRDADDARYHLSDEILREFAALFSLQER